MSYMVSPKTARSRWLWVPIIYSAPRASLAIFQMRYIGSYQLQWSIAGLHVEGHWSDADFGHGKKTPKEPLLPLHIFLEVDIDFYESASEKSS